MKALPWIIVSLIIIVGLIWYVRRNSRPKNTQASLPPDYADPLKAEPTAFTGPIKFTCSCEDDPSVQFLVKQYNALKGTPAAPSAKAAVIDACPCIMI